MKLWPAEGAQAAQIPLLQQALAPDHLPRDLLQTLDERLCERQALERAAQTLEQQMKPRIEAMVQDAVRQHLLEVWQQRHGHPPHPTRQD